MDWLSGLLTTAGNTYATVRNADANILAQQNEAGQAYLQGQANAMATGAGMAGIPTPLLLLGAVALFFVLKD